MYYIHWIHTDGPSSLHLMWLLGNMRSGPFTPWAKQPALHFIPLHFYRNTKENLLAALWFRLSDPCHSCVVRMVFLRFIWGVSQQINTYVFWLSRPIFTSDSLGSDFWVVRLCPSLHNAPGNASWYPWGRCLLKTEIAPGHGVGREPITAWP